MTIKYRQIIDAVPYIVDGYAMKTLLDSYATNSELGTYVEKTLLDSYATSIELDLKADKTTLDSYAASAELSTYAEKTLLDSYATSIELELKADKTTLDSYATSAELSTYAEKTLLDSYATLTDLDLKADKTTLDSYSQKTLLDSYATLTDLDLKADKTTLDSYASSAALYQVKISTDDTTDGYLSDKISAGSNISLSVLNPGGNEILQISSTASGGGSGLIDGYLPLPEKISDPPYEDNYGSVYTKDVDGYTELFYTDNYGLVAQVTNRGVSFGFSGHQEDLPISSPSIYDDEFNGNTLDSKWSWCLAGAPTSGGESYNVANGRLNIVVNVNAGTSFSDMHAVCQSIPGQNFSFRAKLRATRWAAYEGCGLLLLDSVNSYGLLCNHGYHGSYGGAAAVWVNSWTGSWTDHFSSNSNVPNPGMWKIEYNVSTKVYIVYYSMDGFNWVLFWTGSALSFTPDKFGIIFVGRDSGSVKSALHVDWFRVDLL